MHNTLATLDHIQVTLFDAFATHTLLLALSGPIIFLVVQTHLNLLLHPEAHENKQCAHVHCHSVKTVLRSNSGGNNL